LIGARIERQIVAKPGSAQMGEFVTGVGLKANIGASPPTRLLSV
jgi:hypothetical protein